MPVDENKINIWVKKSSEVFALMHMDFPDLRSIAFKESIDSIMLNYESGSYTSAMNHVQNNHF